MTISSSALLPLSCASFDEGVARQASTMSSSVCSPTTLTFSSTRAKSSKEGGGGAPSWSTDEVITLAQSSLLGLISSSASVGSASSSIRNPALVKQFFIVLSVTENQALRANLIA